MPKIREFMTGWDSPDQMIPLVWSVVLVPIGIGHCIENCSKDLRAE